MTRRRLIVEEIARVEGEGALDLEIDDGRVTVAQLRIFEPPRLFEALLRGRDHGEAPDIAARICGICPVAYQLGAAQAMEQALGVRVDPDVRALRRLLYCGEWIESHALHVVLLHAPDFLGYPDAMQMARDHPAALEAGLALKRFGNDVLRILGGREIHPVNVRVGGFHRWPRPQELEPIATRAGAARAQAEELLRWASGFDFPAFERDYEFVAMRDAEDYPLNEGRIVSSRGIDIDLEDFDQHFAEHQVAHSTALQATIRGRDAYLVGPLARYALNFDRLPAGLQALAREAGLGVVCRNPFRSILVRLIEVVYACAEAERLAKRLQQVPAPRPAPIDRRAGVGQGCTEAPRGLCHHRYEIDATGAIVAARIVPPTSQNQAAIEADLRELVSGRLDASDEALTALCERAIRNHDPCISCSAHFLQLRMHGR